MKFTGTEVKLKSIPVVIFFVFLTIVAGCLQPSTSEPGGNVNIESTQAGPWIDMELVDVSTGEQFKISDFKGQPVLLESFAVWCPTCTEQQKQVKVLEAKTGGSIIHISLDTDPNEDASRVKEHKEANGFDWIYAVSPIDLTRSLIDQYGNKIVNAPLVPMILICEDQSTRFLRSGLKTADELSLEVSKGC